METERPMIPHAIPYDRRDPGEALLAAAYLCGRGIDTVYVRPAGIGLSFPEAYDQAEAGYTLIALGADGSRDIWLYPADES
jgi:hypothetical protein